MRNNNNAQEAMKRRWERPLANANPPGTPSINASMVEKPAVIKLLNSAIGKSDLSSDWKLSSVSLVGDCQMGSNRCVDGRNDKISDQAIGNNAKAKNSSIMAMPSNLIRFVSRLRIGNSRVSPCNVIANYSGKQKKENGNGCTIRYVGILEGLNVGVVVSCLRGATRPTACHNVDEREVL